MRVRRLAALCLAAASVAPACKRDPPQPAAPQPEGQKVREGPLQQHRSDERCIAPIDSASARAVARSAKGKLTLGIVAGLKSSSEQNLAQLQSFAQALKARGADVLLADGDVGDTSDEQKVLLGVLTQTGLPLIVVSGNREVRADLDAAEADLRARGATIYDLSHTRAVDFGDALVVGLPGTFDRRQLHTDGACLYSQREVDLLGAFLDRLPASAPPVVLAAAVPPRGQDARALDVSEGQNVGDARLNALLTARRAPFGVFGEVWEAGGRAVDGAGKPVESGAAADQLYLNPGAADLTPWPMSDGTVSNGRAALLTISARRATFEVVRAAPPAPDADAGAHEG